jgi:hypothetical protein
MFGSNSCVLCGYTISDPICTSCCIKRAELLLNDLNLSDIDNETILEKLKSRFTGEILDDTECILCKKENVNFCFYCFSIIFKNVLREFNFDEDSIEEFGYNQLYDEVSLEYERISKPKSNVYPIPM